MTAAFSMRFALALMLVAAWLVPAVAQDPPRPDFSLSSLEIETATGRHRFTVEVADSAEEKAFGLMFVRELADDRGMLFDYPENTPAVMWMKNTFIPLDMLFVRDDGTIRRIVKNTTPQSLKAIRSGGPVRGVVELKAGTADRIGVERNDRVYHPIFGSG